jgi:hypothetical protein
MGRPRNTKTDRGLYGAEVGEGLEVGKGVASAPWRSRLLRRRRWRWAGMEGAEQSRDVSGKETTERERESAIRAEQRSAHAHLDKDLHGPGRHVLY